MLEVKNISKKFGEITAVDNLSFNLTQGHILGLLGANGAGKTTTFRMMLNILKPTEGEVLYDGRKIEYKDSPNIGLLSEERALNGKYTVERQLMLFSELKGLSKSEFNKRFDYWMKYFNLMDRKKSKIKELSKGNQQKVQLISAIIHEPKLLILDEPFTGLDPYNVNLFQEVILSLKEKGTAIIFSSHRLDQIEKFCDEVIVLLEGKPCLSGNIRKLREDSSQIKVIVETNLSIEEIRSCDFVVNVQENGEYYNVFLDNKHSVDKLFDVIKTSKCTHFELVLPTFEEVFIEKVGAAYES